MRFVVLKEVVLMRNKVAHLIVLIVYTEHRFDSAKKYNVTVDP